MCSSTWQSTKAMGSTSIPISTSASCSAKQLSVPSTQGYRKEACFSLPEIWTWWNTPGNQTVTKEPYPRSRYMNGITFTGTCGLRKAGRHIGYVLPLPVPHNRSRIKINYGFILAQYLVSCQLDNTISITFYLFQNIFKYFPARRVFLYITFSGHPDEVFRSLKTEEHTPSCIWVLMAGFLHRVCPARMKSHTVQPVNAAGEGAGNGDGRYVQAIS